jgi:hypothetical protein
LTVVMADQLHRQPVERIKPATVYDQYRVSKDDTSVQNGDKRSAGWPANDRFRGSALSELDD